MSLKHAILVLLDREPGSGYDLRRRFDRGIGHFWQASHQQIYQQLKQLHGEELVEFDTEPQAGKPDRKVYRITTQGQRSLQDWLRETGKPPVVRDALLIRVFAARPEDYPHLIQEIESHLVIHQQKLAAHRQLEAAYFTQPRIQQQRQRLPYLTLRLGIRYEREWIAWLQETLELLRNDQCPAQPV